MTPEGLNGVLDAVPDVEEVTEIPDTNSPIPEVPDTPEIPDGFSSSIEGMKTLEGMKKLFDVEVAKADAVLDFTQDTLEAAEGSVGQEGMLAPELKDLSDLELELGVLGTPDSPKPVGNGLEVSEPEGVTTIIDKVPDEFVEIEGVEMTGLTEKEAAVAEQAAGISYSDEKAKSLDEIRALINKLEEMNAKKYPDDDKYDSAVSVFAREFGYTNTRTPFTVEGDAVDLTTEEEMPIEVIPSGEEQEALTRPSPAELKQAAQDLLSTTHGRIIDMLAYLKDYEAVATGNFEFYHAMIPKDRMEELRRKSSFDTRAESPVVTTTDIKGGLALTWGETADYYDGIGNPSAAEKIRNTGKFEVSESERDLIIGEQHLRLVNLGEYQQRFDGYLARLRPGDIVVVEHPSDPTRNAWSTLSSETRFMQQAEALPNEENGLRLEILDDASGTKWEVWEGLSQETGINRENFYFINGLVDASQRLFTVGGLEGFAAEIQEDESLTDEDKKASLSGIRKFMQILTLEPEQSKIELERLKRLRILYTQLDSICRERSYQEKIAELKEKNPNADLLVVVGNSHRGGIEQALDNPAYRTDLDTALVEEFREVVEEFY